MYLRTWGVPGADPVERAGTESDVIAEFHQLREAGEVFKVELGSLEVASRSAHRAHVVWLSWTNPTWSGAVVRACPHCGGRL